MQFLLLFLNKDEISLSCPDKGLTKTKFVWPIVNEDRNVFFFLKKIVYFSLLLFALNKLTRIFPSEFSLLTLQDKKINFIFRKKNNWTLFLFQIEMEKRKMEKRTRINWQ